MERKKGTMEQKMRWIALVLVLVFVLVPAQVSANEGEDTFPVAGVTEPEATEPEATEPEATEPEATEPEATEPEATEPEATEPGATEPEATEPEATEPEATEPEATEPEATEPAGEQEETPFLEELWAIIVHYWGIVSDWFVSCVHDIYMGIQGQ